VNDTTHIHDFNPGFGPRVSPVDSGNGFGTRVFWTAVIPNGDGAVNLEDGTAALHVHNLPVFDYSAPGGFAGNVSLGPLWQTAYVPATVSFDVHWGGPVTEQVNVKDATSGFAGHFQENQATVTWSAQSSSGFSFTANPGNFSTSLPEVPGVNGVTQPLNFFAEIGFERNGVFFSTDDGGGEASAAGVFRDRGAVAPALPVGVPGAAHGDTLADADHKEWPPDRRPATSVVTRVTGDLPARPADAHGRRAGLAGNLEALDQGFADLDGGVLAGVLRADAVAAWAALGHARLR
jgi:hypothetical protein